MNTQDVARELQSEGYAVVRDFLAEGDVSGGLLKFLSGAEKFHDGVIQNIPADEMRRIQSKIEDAIPPVADLMGLRIRKDRYSYCAIRIKESHDAPVLRQPFDMHRDPKVAPGGALNWHLDHFSYYLHGDHRNWLICYMPVLKPEPALANVAIVPDSTVKAIDPDLHGRIQGRGALRLRGVEADTLEWFRLRFPGQEIAVGDWFAVDDYDDSTMGWKVKIDLEKHKVVPQLNTRDLLIMRADVIHRTSDTACNRISVRCDAMPAGSGKLDTWSGLLGMSLRYPFLGAKRKYNIRIWLKNEWNKRLKRRR